ncbi:MAG TPA: sigma 54-interacting transcriptional regulator [Firmicutes bacterium]|nr:sigma 54-interacting transcriptional regulator [Bacillota bacterium]
MSPRRTDEVVQLKERVDFLTAVLDSLNEGIVVVDSQGIVTFINKVYRDFLKGDLEDFVGKPVTEVLENTRLPIVCQTGEPELSVVQKVRGRNILGHRLPIRKNGKVIGAVGELVFQRSEEIKALVNQVNALEGRVHYYERQLHDVFRSRFTFADIYGHSDAITQVKRLALKAARGDSTVLIMGESGVGKEVFAHAIHSMSPRAGKPFIKVNCAAIPEQLLESEMFGYEEGGFTGAKKGGKPGKFELANHGTIFLDEIGDMSLGMQAKLLRVLQEREMERVGGVKPIQLDIRVIAATNKDLESMVKAKLFRQDLWYRLNVFPIVIPPLRDRREDIPEIAESLLKELCDELRLPLCSLSKGALDVLMSYSWPGNIRELRNALERAVNICEGKEIRAEHFTTAIRNSVKVAAQDSCQFHTLKKSIGETEAELIKTALEASGYNKTKAAKALGIHRCTLYAKIKKYSLENYK